MPTPSPTLTPGLVGDANCDGLVDATDALRILQLVLNLVQSLPCPDLADASGNGAISAFDASLVLQFVARLVPVLPLPL